MQESIIEAVRPIYESGPKAENISVSRPVAADDENIFIIIRGTSSDGNLIISVTGFTAATNTPERFDFTNIDEAHISAISTGRTLA